VLSEGHVLHDTYRLVRLVGEGGMGLVYEATHARLSGRYAVKVLHQRLWTSPEAVARFDREARVTSQLQHPNIVQVIDFNTAPDGTEYLVMEFLDGESLAKRLQWQGRLGLEQVVGIVSQIAAGLAAAHAHGVVHRDLKPDNVLLVPVEGRDGELAKVLDFGISKVDGTSISLQGKEGTLFGTPQYMAPEQCEGRVKDVGPAADQFALAAISYELLTGRPAFSGDNLGDILSQIIYDQPAPMHAGYEVEAVVLRGLAKSPTERYPSIAAFAEALAAAASAPTRALSELPTMAYALDEGLVPLGRAPHASHALARRLPSIASATAGDPRTVSGTARTLMVMVGVVVSIGATLAVGHAEGGAGWLAAHRATSTERLGALPRLGRSIGRSLGHTLDQVLGESTTATRASTELAELAPITRESSRAAAPVPTLPGGPEATPEGTPDVSADDPRDPDSREAARTSDSSSHGDASSGSGAATREVAGREARVRRGAVPPSAASHPRARQAKPVAFGVALARTARTTSTTLPTATEPPRPVTLPAPEAPEAPEPSALPVADSQPRGLGAAAVPAMPEPATHRVPVDENAPLPLDEDGENGLANRPLGLVE
jgi:serine/threonine-protein kinase